MEKCRRRWVKVINRRSHIFMHSQLSQKSEWLSLRVLNLFGVWGRHSRFSVFSVIRRVKIKKIVCEWEIMKRGIFHDFRQFKLLGGVLGGWGRSVGKRFGHKWQGRYLMFLSLYFSFSALLHLGDLGEFRIIWKCPIGIKKISKSLFVCGGFFFSKCFFFRFL